jgi:hypothetical protein
VPRSANVAQCLLLRRREPPIHPLPNIIPFLTAQIPTRVMSIQVAATAANRRTSAGADRSVPSTRSGQISMPSRTDHGGGATSARGSARQLILAFLSTLRPISRHPDVVFRRTRPPASATHRRESPAGNPQARQSNHTAS